MANSPLPLIIGAAAAFLILSKKGGGTQSVPNIIIISKPEDFDISDAQIGELEDKYDAGASIVAGIPDLTSEKLATAAVGIAQENPKTVFFVFSAASFVTVKGASGLLNVSVSRKDTDLHGTQLFTKVTPEMVSEKVPAGYNFAVKDLNKKIAEANAGANAGGSGQRGLAGSAPAANTRIGGARGLASSAPASNLASSGWFRRLKSATNI